MARGDFFRNMSPEQRAEFDRHRTERMRENKALKKEMAKKPVEPEIETDIRLPHGRTPLTTKGLFSYLHKLGIPVTLYSKWNGLTLKKFCEYNPHMTLRKVIIIALEHKQDILSEQ